MFSLKIVQGCSRSIWVILVTRPFFVALAGRCSVLVWRYRGKAWDDFDKSTIGSGDFEDQAQIVQESAGWDGVHYYYHCFFSMISMELTVFRMDFGFHEFRMVDTYPSFCLGWHGILNLHASMSRPVLPYLISREVYNPPSTHRFEPSLDERKIWDMYSIREPRIFFWDLATS